MPTGVRRLAAFTTDPAGGNPAGVWIGDELPDVRMMQRLARSVGYSETAFVAPAEGRVRTIRYFSPEAEVPFCGHATIATGVVLGDTEGPGEYELHTQAGVVAVLVSPGDCGYTAALTSVEPEHTPLWPHVLDEILASLGWTVDDLDPAIPSARAYAGAWHAVLAAGTRARLADLHYEFETLKKLMLETDLTTVQLVWRESADVFHSRNPFPVGGVVEDPATGAAAAALGGYLRDAALIEAPRTITIHQGVDLGRPSLLHVDIPVSGGIIVRGAAVPIPG